jgi:hypothetical protein
MSVEQVARGDGTKVWRVRWRDEHGRNRSKTLGRKRDAEAFDAEIRRLRRLGELGLMDAGRVSLAEFGQEWLVAYAVPNLEPKTLRTYESLWDRHVLPNIGGVELRQLRPAVLDRYLAQLQRDGLSPAQREEGRRDASGRTPAGGGVGAHRPEPDARGTQTEGPQADRDPTHRPGPGRAAPAPPARRRPTALRNARVRARLLRATTRRSPRADLGRRRRAHHRGDRRQLDGPIERNEDRRRAHRAAAPTTRAGPLRVATRPRPPRSGRHCVPWRLAGRHAHRGPVEPMDPGHVPSRQARGGAAERARIRPAPLVRLAADPRGPVDPRGRTPGRPLAANMPTRLRPPLRRVRPLQPRARGGRDRRRPCKLVPLSYLSADAKRREAARRAENPYSGISHSGNQRDTSSSNGSSFPTWDCRRSSRSLSRACSPFAGTNG